MSLGVQIGLLLALATSLTSVVGFLLKARGAAEAPPIEWSRPVASSLALFGSGWYSLGILVAMGGWGLHVGALALAPISLVQATIAGGLVFLTLVADRVFGHDVSRREWIGVAMTALGLAFLAGTLERGATGALAEYTPLTLGFFLCVLVVAAGAAWRTARAGKAGAPALALSAGLLWGASDTAIKALSGSLGHVGAAGILFHPLAFLILGLSLVGLLVSAGSLQVGDAVPVIAVTSAAANICTIAAGPLVFREPLPASSLGVVVHVTAFALVIAAAALTPPPLAAVEP